MGHFIALQHYHQHKFEGISFGRMTFIPSVKLQRFVESVSKLYWCLVMAKHLTKTLYVVFSMSPVYSLITVRPQQMFFCTYVSCVKKTNLDRSHSMYHHAEPIWGSLGEIKIPVL